MRPFVCTVVSLAICAIPAPAMPAMVDTVKMPIGRLITNLEARVKQQPDGHGQCLGGLFELGVRPFPNLNWR